MVNHYEGINCQFCGRQATTARFGHFVCDDEECTEKARARRVCGGKEPDITD